MMRQNRLVRSAATWQILASILSGGVVLAVVAGGTKASAASGAGVSSSQHTTTNLYATLVSEASQRYAIPAAWIDAVIHAESDGKVRALSTKGAIGLMQIMPKTWDDLRVRYKLGADPFDPHDNILAGTAYLRELYDRYGAPGFLAAYNAGSERYEDYLTSGRELPAETRAYLTELGPMMDGRSLDRPMFVSAMGPLAPTPLLFVAQGGGERRYDGRTGWRGLVPQSAGLFVPVSSRQR